METVFKHVNGVVAQLTQLFIAMLSLGVVGQLLLGDTIFGWDVIGNVMNVIGQLGDGGFVGILALLILWSLFSKDKQ